MAKNPFLQQFVGELRSRYPQDGSDMSYSDWLCANTHLGARKFSTAGYEFQRAIIDDMTPGMTVIKPSQVGMTEVMVRKYLAFLARNRGTSGILTFPNEKMFKSNSKTRIRPVVGQSAFNSTGMMDDRQVRSVNLYEINGSFAHITGMTEGDATSTPADILFHDELDLSDQTMVGLFQSRLQNSDFKIDQAFSTPTHPGFGVDARYRSSDQREYMHRCSCGHWSVPTFDIKFLNLPGYKGDGKLSDLDADSMSLIDFDNVYVKCERCDARLDLTDPSQREWVAQFPARQAHGYRVRPFSTARLPPTYILSQLLKMKTLDNIKGWHNTVLGETYSDGSSRLEPDVIRKVMVSPEVPEVSGPVALGCDMGKTCHLTLGKIRGDGVDPFLFEQVHYDRVEERIKQLRAKYNIICGGVDRHPYTPTSNKISLDSGRKILPIEYRGVAHVHVVNDEYGQIDFVQINRTAAIDAQVRAIQQESTQLSGYGGMGHLLIEQLCDMVRVEADEKPATWEKLTGNDHFMHSLVLMRAAVRAHSFISSTEVKPGSLIGLIAVQTPYVESLGAPSRSFGRDRLYG
jgi:hypothetical protein